MLGKTDRWPHQVEIDLTRDEFDARLRSIEAWLNEWDIPHRIGSTLGASQGTLRICFTEAKFARAFIAQQGGRLLPDDEIERALSADAEDDELYRSLADEYDD